LASVALVAPRAVAPLLPPRLVGVALVVRAHQSGVGYAVTHGVLRVTQAAECRFAE
jgi:hypothetical protein